MKLIASVLVIALASFSWADFATNFEATEGYAVGDLNGQNGWSLPSSGGVSGVVENYAGNAGGFVQDPYGGSQFVDSHYVTDNARSVHAIDYTVHGNWTVSFDLAVNYTGTSGSAVNNIGSLSLENYPANRSFISLNLWDDTNPSSWSVQFYAYDAAGSSTIGLSAGSGFTGLKINNWYRESISVDFATNAITTVSLTNLSDNSVVSYNPTGWYMGGGASNTGNMTLPVGVRLFGGGSADNHMGWDNFQAVPEPAGLAAMAVGLLGLTILRRRK